MKITAVKVSNTLGISHASIDPHKPIVMVAGDNGAGKTSLYQAIRLALFDELPRVDLKKEAGELVRGGANRGSVSVVLQDDGTHGGIYNVMLPDRKRTAILGGTIVRMLFEPSRFARLESNERMRLILNLSEVSLGKDAIVKRLEARGIAKPVLDELSPLLVLGFEKCALHATQQAATHRGAWKGITGETYGSKKAEGWTAPSADALPGQPVGLAEAMKAYQDATEESVRLTSAERHACEENEAREKRWSSFRAQREADTAAVGKMDFYKARIADLKPIAEAAEERTYPACPHCGGTLDIVDGKIVASNPPASTAAKYTKRAIANAKAELKIAQDALAEAENARGRLTAPAPEREPYLVPPEADRLDKAAQKVVETSDVLRTLQSQQATYAAAVAARAGLAEREQRAAAEHALVQAWEQAEEALSPTGIPSELMSQAMLPFRAAVKAACASESVQDWPLPEIADDGSISAWGRPYALLSDSEQWRADAILAAALAIQTGLGIIAIDRADVLAPRRRAELIGWLWDLTEDAKLEQAWVFATLKAPPEAGPVLEVHWVADGTTADARAAA